MDPRRDWLPLLFASCLAFTSSTRAQESLTLVQAVDLALANNPQILAVEREVEAARARILQAEAFPNLELGLSWEEIPSDFDIGAAGERNLGLVQPIEFPGKRGARGRVAKLETTVVEEQLQRTRRLIAADVKHAYYEAWLDQKLVGNLETIVGLLEQFRATATARYQAQRVAFLEVLRAKIELAKVQNELIATRREEQNSLAQLNRLLGRPGSTPTHLADDFTYQPFDKPLETVVSEMQEASRLRRSAQARQERGVALVRLARKSYLPDFAVGLFNQKRDGQPPFTAENPLGTTENGLWGFDVGVSVPLGFWKGPRGQLREARALHEQARLERSAIERDVVTAIENAYRSVKAAEDQVRIFEASLLRDAEDVLRAGISHYQNNQIDALNLIDIYRTYTQTRTEYHRALFNYLVALADLEVAGETSQP